MDKTELRRRIREKKRAMTPEEIENLKEIQTNITNQYNELSDYTGKLQDEVRKLRCNY